MSADAADARRYVRQSIATARRCGATAFLARAQEMASSLRP